MDVLHDIHLIGISHRTAPVAVRERYAVQPADARPCLVEMGAAEDVSEVLLLSTCNRTEVLVVAAEGRDPAAAVRRRVFRNLADEHVYAFSGVHAVIQLFRVAAGLDSLVLGESEILAQLKAAVAAARDAGTLGTTLSPLTAQALSVGKRVRTETSVGSGSLSVAKVAVELARRAFGDFADNEGLVVGAGETGLVVARHLKAAGMRAVHIASRTVEHAREAARELGGRAYALEDLREALRGPDVVVICVDGGPVLRAEHLRKRRRDQPQLIVDLSVPRGVAAGVGERQDVLLYDLDDLEPVVQKNLRARVDASEKCAEILVGEVHKFLALRTYAAFSPAITDLRRRFEEVREAVLDGVTRGKASPRELELAHELSKRLLDLALDKMKEGARRARSETALDREYQRFLDRL